jgi:Lrp/AsnC family transcriptional regulator, regulator for asnA, asnC and gidA
MTGDYDFDELDEKIVALFQKDGRSSNRAVSRALSLSEGAVRKRMKRLLDTGAISYGLVVDTKASGMDASCWLKVSVKPGKARAVANFIGALETCAACFLSTGESSIHAFVYALDRVTLGKLVADIGSRDGVLELNVR